MENNSNTVIRKKVGLITLAIMLILLGTVALVNKLSDTSILRDPYVFWPIFLILLGLEVIITKLVYDSKGKKIDIRLDFLSILIVCIILLFNSIFSGLSMFDLGSFFTSGFKYQYKTTAVFNDLPFEDVELLDVQNRFGNVYVTITDEQNAKIEADISLKPNAQVDEQKLKDMIKVYKGKTFSIKAQNLEAFDDSNSLGISYRIYVPAKDIGVKVQNSMGNVEINDIKGKIQIDNEFGNVEITNPAEDAMVKVKHGNIVLNSDKPIKSNYDMNTTFGDITMCVPCFEDVIINAEASYGNIQTIQDMKIDNHNNRTQAFYKNGTGQNKVILNVEHGCINFNIL
ncbi:MAG: DUF4097 family beta strand repeat-containing protein [Clostridia bacterium]|nr:DUF4097 family beta strand repeat-containing protein [Clostridia bacterium]